MKFRNLKKFVPAAILLFAMTSLTSCNRGMGCPNNFSIGDASEVIINLLSALF